MRRDTHTDAVDHVDAIVAQITHLGHTQAPVVTVGEEHWSGSRPDKITDLTTRNHERDRR